MCFEHKENGFRAQFVLALLGCKILLCQIQRLLAGGKTELGLLKLVYGVCHLKRYLLAQQAFVIQVAAARDQPCSQVSLSAAILNGQIEGQRESIAGKSEAKDLIQRVAEAARRHLRRSDGIDLVSSQAVAGVCSAQTQVRQEIVVSEANVGVIVRERLAYSIELRAGVQGHLKSSRRVDS